MVAILDKMLGGQVDTGAVPPLPTSRRRRNRKMRVTSYVRVLLDLRQRLRLLHRQVTGDRAKIGRSIKQVGRDISEERARQRAERKSTEKSAAVPSLLFKGYTPFRTFIRRIRRLRGLSVSEAARRTGTGRPYLASVESGRIRPPKAPSIHRFAQFYDVPERYLQLLAFADKSPWTIRRDLISLLFPEDRPSSFDKNSTGTSVAGQDRRDRKGHGRLSPFGKLLRRLRKERGLSQTDLAFQAKVDPGFITVIETSTGRAGSPKLVRRLAAVLGVDKQALQILAYSERAPKVIRAVVLRRLSPLTPLLRPGASRPQAVNHVPANTPNEASSS